MKNQLEQSGTNNSKDELKKVVSHQQNILSLFSKIETSEPVPPNWVDNPHSTILHIFKISRAKAISEAGSSRFHET